MPATRSRSPVRSERSEADTLRRVYEVCLLTRLIDELLWLLSRQGSVSFVLTARGHEVAQVASTTAMRHSYDTAWPYYRDMGVGLALGVTPFEIFLGALGRAGDPHSGGRQLTMHLSSPELGIGSISSAIAAHIPHAVGAAYAARVQGEDRVAMCWFGEGATSEGVTHEAMNLAGIHKLGVVFLCENNGLAISVPQERQIAGGSVAARAGAYGMPGMRVDGGDALAVLGASRQAVERARAGEGPTLIEMTVPRITPHSSQDDDLYRSAAEREAAVRADPLPRLRAWLIREGLLTESEDAQVKAGLDTLVQASLDDALIAPQPAPERARRWLFAGDPAHDALRAASSRGWTGVFDG